MANELVRFTMGTKTDLGTKTKEAGQILFVLNDDNKSGSIYLDKDATHRIRMSHDLKDTSNSFSESAVNVTTYSGKVYPVALDADGYLAVSVPWTNTTYSAGTGLTLASGNKFNHTNSITAGTASGSATGTISFGGTITIPSISYDSEGHITSTSTTTLTLPANPNVDTKVNQTNTTGNDNYRVLFSGTADDTTRAEGARKNTSFKYNPSTTTLSVPKINTTGDISITNIAETDKFLNFSYAGADAAGASWRLGHLGSGSGDTNYFVIQSGTSNTSATTWNNVLRLGMNTYDATFSGNVNPAVTNTKTLGTSDLKWANVYATTFTGNLSGNATSANSAISASKFTAAQSITLTGDVTGTASSVAGWSIATTLKDSGATAGDYGNTGDVSATYGGTFKVPTLTVDSKGIVTAISEKTITLPVSDNVDNKVSQTITSTNANYRVLFSGTADNTTRTEGARKDGDFYYNPSTNTLTVPTVAAALSGNATTATTASKLDPTLDAGSSTQPIYFDNGVPVAITGALANDITGNAATATTATSATSAATATTANKLGTTTVGGVNKPIYLSNGAATEANTYAGGTAVTLNGSSKASSTASFYAPTGAGTSGQYLKSSGSGAPVWETFPTSMAPIAHSHGNITNDGKIASTTETLATNDFIIIGDNDASGKIIRGPKFDTSVTNKALTQAGTWATFTANTGTVTSVATGTGLTGGPITTSGTISLADSGVTAASYGNAANATVSATGGTFKTTYLTVDAKGRITAASDKTMTVSVGNGTITNAMLANSSMSIAGSTVSLGGTLSADTLRTNLGLSSAMHYRGRATVTITDGGTEDPTITGYTFSNAQAGDVILSSDNSMEYVWTGTAWELLGSETSFKIVQNEVTTPAASGESISFIDNITQNTNGNIVLITKKTVPTASTSKTGIIQITKANLNSFINTLDTGSSTPVDADYYISQYVNGGTTTTTYHRRPMSALWAYIKGKINASTDAFTISISGNAATATTANKLGTNAGSSSQPVYFANGVPVAITGALGNDITGNAATATSAASATTASKATAANITTNTNAVAIYTNTTGTFGNVRSASGAFYSTGQDVAPKFGTLPVAQGGTGATTISAYAVVYGNSSGNGYTGLGANTTTTKKFLRMTGTGSAGTAPAWDTVTKSDVGLGNVENTALSTWTGNTSISSIGTLTTGSIPWSLITGVPGSFTPGTHSHGNITNAGTMNPSQITIANNDFIVVGDSSDSSGKLTKGPIFDGSTTSSVLSQKGTWQAASPSVSITAGTSSDAPKVNITVLGASGTAQALTKASTSVYGVTKLSSTASSSEEGLAATPKGVQAAINALDVSDAAVNGQYVKQVTQTDGKITVTRADFAPSISITAGTSSAAPKVNVTVNTKSGTAQSITTATTGVYGVTKLSSTSSTSEEGLAATPKGVWAAIDTVKYKVTQTADATNFEYPILTKSTVGVGTVTETVKFNSSTGKQTTINPSTGTISANSYKVADKVQLQYDATTESLNFVFI